MRCVRTKIHVFKPVSIFFSCLSSLHLPSLSSSRLDIMPSFSSSLKGPCGAHGRKTGQLLASHTHSSDKEGPSSSPSSNLDSRLISCLELAIPSLLSSLHSSFFFLVTHLPSLETRHTRHSSLVIRGAALTSGRVRCVRRIMIPNSETAPVEKRRHGQVTRAGTLNILPPRLGF